MFSVRTKITDAAEATSGDCGPSVTRSTGTRRSFARATAMAEGGWFDFAQDQAVREAMAGEDPDLRARTVRTLIAEETRLGMLVGVAVGFELARELAQTNKQED